MIKNEVLAIGQPTIMPLPFSTSNAPLLLFFLSAEMGILP
jgi:hypothetical protein